MTAAGPATLKVGVQIRVGDAKLANAPKKGDRRYPPGCDPPLCQSDILPAIMAIAATSDCAR